MLALISVTISFKNNKILPVVVAFRYCSHRQRKAATVYMTHLTFVILKLMRRYIIRSMLIRVITKLPNSEQSYKGKVKTHNYINRQNQSTTGKL